jgi:hypothetical protein
MKRTILITMLSAAAMFAQSTPQSSAPVTPQTSKTTAPAHVSKKAAKKAAKKTTAKPVTASKTPVAPVAPVKQ